MGLIGGYGGLVCGMTAIGGLVGVLAAGRDREHRAEAATLLIYGSVATACSAGGYLLGSRISLAMLGFFTGLVVPAPIVARIAVHIYRAQIKGTNYGSATVALAACSAVGAGLGAWVGTLGEHPAWVAVGLVIGSVLGATFAHRMNRSILEATTAADARDRHHWG